MSEGQEFGGDGNIARVAAERAEAAEKAQEGAAARDPSCITFIHLIILWTLFLALI